MSAHVEHETLVALWAGELPGEQVIAVEEHIFSCDACADAAARLARIIEAVGESIPPVISQAHRARLAAAGLRLRVTSCEPDAEATARFTAETDLLIHVLRGNLAGAERVDLEMLRGEHAAITMESVPFSEGEVLIACQRHYQSFFPGGEQPTFRVTAHRGGRRERVGDYRVVHIWE